MSDLPFPWNIYEETQEKAARCGRVTDWSWGIEAGLNKFLAAVESSCGITDPKKFQNSVDKAIATGSRVERHRTQLRRRFLRQDPERHAETHLLANACLAEIRNIVSSEEWELLISVAAGITCREIAASRGITAGSVRVRLFRLRARLARKVTPLLNRG